MGLQQRKIIHCAVTHFPAQHADFCNQKQKNQVKRNFKIKYRRLAKSYLHSLSKARGCFVRVKLNNLK